MALVVTKRAENALNQLNVKAQIILEIDGISTVFGAVPVTVFWRLDEGYFLDSGLFLDTPVELDGQKDYISLRRTTKKVNQQIQPDKANASSVSSINVELVDKDDFVTSILTTGGEVEDVLGRKAKFYYALQGTAHPEDSVRVFTGIVSELNFGAQNVLVRVSHSEQKKRQSIFQQSTQPLLGNIGPSDTTISVSATDFILPGDAVTSYARIGDEIISYTSKSPTQLLGCTRAQLGTTATSHSIGDDVTSFYRLQGQPLDLALKVMLSGGASNETNETIGTSFVFTSGSEKVENAIQTTDLILVDRTGITVGDLVDCSGSTEAANNFTGRTIVNIIKNDSGYYIVVDGTPLVEAIEQTATLSFRSKYDVLPDGAGLAMTMDEVDVERHEFFIDLFSVGFVDMDIYIKETVEGKELINKDIYFPNSIYSIPRRSRTSLNITIPPLSIDQIILLNEGNILNPESLEIGRSINDAFYNAVIFRFEEDSIEDKFLRNNVQVSATSIERIRAGAKPLYVVAKGFRDNNATRQTILTSSRRFLDRYQFAAEKVKRVRVNMKTGYNIEVGDAVIADFSNLKVADNRTNSRFGLPKVMECTNKSLDVGGFVELELTNTAFDLDGRYGIISPSSFVGVGSTTSKIVIKKSFTTPVGQPESQYKWKNHLNSKIVIRNDDWSFSEETFLRQIDPQDPNALIVDPPIASAPIEDYIVDIANYDDSSVDVMSVEKDTFCFINPQVSITSGASTTVFDVDPLTVDRIFIGSIIEVHNLFWTVTSQEVEVIDVTGTQITVNQELVDEITEISFTPASGYLIDLIGFKDKGKPYRVF